MLSQKIADALNTQVAMEASASQNYLAMACWCDSKGLSGCAQFLYNQAEEERMHMMKFIQYINESGSFAIAPAVPTPQLEYNHVQHLFETAYQNEKAVSAAIDNLVDIATQERDKQTANFLQWFLDEQHEEETSYRSLLDRISLIGLEGRGLYFIDKEVENLVVTQESQA